MEIGTGAFGRCGKRYVIGLLVLLSTMECCRASDRPANFPASDSNVAEPSATGIHTTVAPTAISLNDQTMLRPPIQTQESSSFSSHPLTLPEAISIAESHYPKVLKARIQINAARDSVALQKITEYMPEALFQYQEIMASRNKLTQVIYGSPVFPGNPGPGLDSVSMRPIFFSGGGFNLDWQPLDFGLHKARINLSKASVNQSTQDARVTEFDTQISTALNFLDAVVAKAQVQAATANVEAFQQIKTSVDTQVRSRLRAGADSFLASAEVARASTILVRARLAEQVALSNLANALGIAGQKIDITPGRLSGYVERDSTKFRAPDFELNPLISAEQATIARQTIQRTVLSKQYYPTLHWLFGTQLRGSGLNVRARDQSANVFGLFPCVPNYQLAMILNWNFLDFARLRQEKKIQDKRIQQSQLDLELIRNNLKTEDLQTRAQLNASYQIVENARIQLKAAEMAVSQSKTRYDNGLSSIAQLAEASQSMAQARLEEAQAQVGLWKVLLSMAAVRGDLKPFMDLIRMTNEEK